MQTTKTSRRAAWGTGLLAILALGATSAGLGAEATDTTNPLLDLFIKKGYVTQDEAEKVEAEAEAMRSNNAAYAPPPASKWKITDGIKQVELFGDLRMRYEDRSATDPQDSRLELQRLRYAIRFGLRGDAFDNFYYGFRLETAANPRSPWVTLGTSTVGNSPYQGPFGKSTDTIAIGQAFLGWRPESWVDVAVGKLPNLLYATPMLWDSDLNPEGGIERLKYTVGQADLFANFGQFLYADFNPNYAASGLGINGENGQITDNIFLFVWQGGFNYHITPGVSAKVAATLYQYTGLQRSSQSTEGALAPYFGDPYIGEGAYYYAGGSHNSLSQGYGGYSPGAIGGAQGNFDAGYGSVSYPFNQVGLNHLLVLDLPFELNFNVKTLNAKARLFGDFAYNLQGARRAQDAANAYAYVLSQAPGSQNPLPHSFPAQTGDVKAYQIGFGIGSDDLQYGPNQGLVYGTASHKHDWEARAYWQHIEQYALDPNLVDSDFFEGRENMEGIYSAVAYAVSDNFILTLRYGYAQRINSLLGTGGSNQDIPQVNPINHYALMQLDATLRF